MQTQIYNHSDFQNMFIEERDGEIRQLLKQQQEINLIFKDMATLVEDQSEMVDDIRSNITSSTKDVNKATKFLNEAEKEQKTGLKLAFGILVATMTTVSAATLAVIFGT